MAIQHHLAISLAEGSQVVQAFVADHLFHTHGAVLTKLYL